MKASANRFSVPPWRHSLAGVAALAMLCGCGGSEDTSATDESAGVALCCTLGAVCHPGPNDPLGGEVRRCHDLGHRNVGEDCSVEFDACMQVCAPEGSADAGIEEHACIRE